MCQMPGAASTAPERTRWVREERMRSGNAADGRSWTGSYPCRCLCRGLSHITRITPRRLMILHFEQIALTDDRTFIFVPSVAGAYGNTPLLAEPVRDPPAGQVVRRQFHRDLVPRKNLDVVHPHLPRNVGEDAVSVLQGDPEHRIGQRFENRPLHFDGVFFGHRSSPRPPG